MALDIGPDGPSERFLVISCDCHTQGRAEDYRPYIEPKFRDSFEQWAAESLPPGYEGREKMFASGNEHTIYPQRSRAFHEHEWVKAGAERALFDFQRRIVEMERDGIVGDVAIQQGYPFSNFGGAPYGTKYDWPTRKAGVRAANQWLADRCAENPGRHAGLALIPDMDDIEYSAKEIDRLFHAGLKGGIMLPFSPTYEWPAYNHERYYPLWEVLNEHKLAVHTHLGTLFGGAHTTIEGPGGDVIDGYENHFRSARPFWCMYFGGVFERYPNIKFSFTEHGIEWIPEMIRHMTTGFYRELEAFKEQMDGAEIRWRDHQLSPIDVWKRQGFAGASFMPKAEADRRHELGVDKIMWGSDYPHIEGTWPNTRMKLARALANMPKEEKALILGENALRCYETAFDEKQLREAASRVGILAEQV